MFRNYAKNILFLLTWMIYAISPSFLQATEFIEDAKESLIKKDKNKLCLTMIVKNESSIIERCLTSVKDIVDCISICDTGSTDNTVEIIETFMKDNQIPGKIYHHDWQNFGYNRTLSVQAARKTLEELNFPLVHTYLLLLDADMILEIGTDFNKNDLKDDAYLMLQESFGLAYYNIRLVRAFTPWECVGVTHEYWTCKNAHQTGNLLTLSINDRDDGGCKADKFERDIKLLSKGLEDEPENVRYMFYLAQSYKCLNRYDEAIKWYKARIEKTGWNEEVWYSKLMVGECYQDLGFWDQALHWYLDAYQYNSARAEPLHKIASYYRIHGQNDLAYLFAKQGSRIPYPKNQILFISNPVYEYQFDEEISITAYYTPFKEEGFAAANRLILNKNVPVNSKQLAYKNLLFYVQNLAHVHYKPITIELPLIRKGMDQHYNLTNPSIQKIQDGYHLICRTVNFTQKYGLEYKSLDPFDKTIRTKNFLVHYDQNFNLISQKEIIDELTTEKLSSPISGLEDCRLIGLNKNLWFTATTYDNYPEVINQSLCKLSNTSSDNTIKVEKRIELQGRYLKKYEKNWLPFIKDGEIYAIYAYDPFVIYKINPENGNCEIIREYQSSHDFSHFRGSAAPIEFDDGYLVLVHEVIFSNQRYYLHRFIYLDKDFNIQKLSKPFTFFHKGIEYCCGMTLDHSGKKCIFPIGFEDRQAYLAFIDLENIQKLLEPLP